MRKSYPLVELIEGAVVGARKQLKKIEGGSAIERAGVAFGDPERDTEIKADRVLGEYFAQLLSTSYCESCRVTVEGGADVRLDGEDRTLWYCVDPLDGSLDYACRNGALGLPFSACVTVLGKADAPMFADIQAACIGDLRCTDIWSSVRAAQHDDLFHAWQDGEPLRTHEATRLDLGSQIVIGEMYYPENREKLARAFVGKKGYLRSIGSAAYEMAMVANGTAVAFVCDRQKQHELGAGYALVKGAGGVAVDWDGKDLGPRAYDFKTQTPCVLAANASIAEDVLELLRKGG